MIAVAADIAAMTEAWASSGGLSGPERRDMLDSLLTAIARFCQAPAKSGDRPAATCYPFELHSNAM
jgi:hypothetical protein